VESTIWFTIIGPVPAAFFRVKPRVLCYHAVTGNWDDELAVDPEVFEAQIRSILRAGYVPAPAEKVVGSSGKLLHVTFDDAFRNIRSALDLLLSLGVSATVFACSDLADDGRPLQVGDLGGLRAPPDREGETMVWDELRELAESGVEIGSHTCSHPHLTELSDAELRRELCDSRERIEDELRRPCAYLAYPFGEHDARVRAASRMAGYTAAFAQASSLRVADPYAVYRVSVYRRDSAQRLALKLSRLGMYASARRRGG
jgi:peptidoglycan/xylan/chitin deacetylase (PgdA/CDA1 family)